MKTIHDQSYLELIANLRRLRSLQSISQNELSTKLGKNQSYISKIECGDRRLDVIELMNICVALNIKLTEVLPQKYQNNL